MSFVCEEHGRQPWRGDIRCKACGAVYPAGEGLGAMPDFCTNCKVRLLPDPRDRSLQWFGASACPVCVADQAAKAGP